jgi:hypothetical protein
MLNRNKILKQSLAELVKKKIKTEKYEKVEAVLTEWCRQKQPLNSWWTDPFLKER